eukprot:6769390-Lingulodinium_polyedra.AAC.1
MLLWHTAATAMLAPTRRAPEAGCAGTLGGMDRFARRVAAKVSNAGAPQTGAPESQVDDAPQTAHGNE